MIPYVVLGLPRSNTYWLSQFLSTDRRPCLHDPSRRWRSRAEVAPFFRQHGAAAVDTALGLIWDEVAVPGVRVVVIHRPVAAVEASLRRIGIDPSGMVEYARKLWAIDGLHFQTTDLDNAEEAAQLFDYCVGEPFNLDRWRRLRRMRLECDPALIMREAMDNLDGIRAVFGSQGEDACSAH